MYRHGHRGLKTSRTYKSWQAMIDRCTRSGTNGFHNYGGRGIVICSRWRGDDGFVNFLADMGERPEGHTLDRVDTDGHYEPSNCQWSTLSEQQLNRRDGLRHRTSQQLEELAARRRDDDARRQREKRAREALARGPRVLATHCRSGHEFTPANTYVHVGTGNRYCRECRAIYARERKRSNRAAA